MDKILKTCQLTAAQYSALAALEEKERLTNAELARACYVKPQTMYRMLQNLQERKLIQSEAAEDSKLKVYFRITKKANKLLCQAHELVNELEEKMTRNLSSNQIKGLLKALKSCLEALSRP